MFTAQCATMSHTCLSPAVLGDVWLWHDESQCFLHGNCGGRKGSERHRMSRGFNAEDREEVPAGALPRPVDGGRLGAGEGVIVIFLYCHFYMMLHIRCFSILSMYRYSCLKT